ncbi:MAG: hypothetical protein QM499_05135, partial [Flavobacteriaceae bacterium]
MGYINKKHLRLKRSLNVLILSVIVFMLFGQIAISQEFDFNNNPEQISSLAINDILSFVDPEISQPDKETLNYATYVKVYIDGDQEPFIPYSLKISLEITPYNYLGVPIPSQEYTRTILVAYNPSSNYGNFSDLAVHQIKNRFGLDAKIVSILALNTDTGNPLQIIPENAYIQLGFKGDRYYELDTTLPNVSVSSNSTSVQLSWQPNGIEGAIEYDVEWTWVDNYGLNGSTLNENAINFSQQDFKLNSTRIQTKNTHYEIPIIYSQGFLIYRVRAIGRFLTSTNTNFYGNWSLPNNPNASKVSHWAYKEIYNSHEDKKNWQFQTSYAEDGKRKDVVSYFDGTLRNRQTVTRINSDDNAIVGEVIYDAQGRPAIEVLPVPTGNSEIKYYEDFNKNKDNNIYTSLDFDYDSETEECEIELIGMSPVSGSSKYYSPPATNPNTYQDFVPSALDSTDTTQGYPFSQIEYTPDNTGRISRKSGVGLTHQLGTGKEMQYFYGQPNSSFELNRLFGFHVGKLSHYKKNVVSDPNGQVSISYIDPQGRTIATALAGGNPDQLIPLGDEIDENDEGLHTFFTADLLNKLNVDDTDNNEDNNIKYASGNFGVLDDGLKVFKQIVVIENNSDYEFGYKLENTALYSFPNCPETFPYEYDLKLRVADECSEQWVVDTLRVQSYDEPFTPVTLNLGEYQVFKDLRVSQEALNEHWDNFLVSATQNGCLLTEEDFTIDINIDCELNCDELPSVLNDYIIIQLEDLFGVSPLPYIITGGVVTANPLLPSEIIEQVEIAIEDLTETYPLLLEICDFVNSTFNDVYSNILLTDFYLGGQYAKTDVNSAGEIVDPLSIFNENNSIYYNGSINGDGNSTFTWRNPIIPYAVDGEISKIQLQEINGEWLPETTDYADPDANNKIFPQELANIADFLSYWDNDWAKSLVPYHPEYKYLLYTDAVNEYLPQDYNSYSYTDYLQNITSYEDAVAEGLFSSRDELMDGDPYFDLVSDFYSETASHRTARRNLMQYALNTDYEANGMPLLEGIYAIAKCGSLSNSCSIPSSFSSIKADIDANMTIEQQDFIWNSYKSYYIGLKERLFYVFLTIHAKGQDVHNYCLGGETGSLDILDVLSNYDTLTPAIESLILDVDETLNSLCSLAVPNTYSLKEKRFIPIDYQYDAAQYEEDPDVFLDELLAGSEQEIFAETGMCPMQFYQQIFLNGLFNDSNVADIFTTNGMLYTGTYFPPELFEALGGVSGSPTIKATISNNTLDIDPQIAGQCSNPFLLDLPTGTTWDTSHTWNNYGTTWNITEVSHFYYDVLNPDTSRYYFKVLVKLDNGTEFVFDGSTCIDLGTCIIDPCECGLFDTDFDDVFDNCDICPNVYNPAQNSTDVNPANGIPDECENDECGTIDTDGDDF